MKKRFALLLAICLMPALGMEVFACTTFIISGKVTTDGKPILFKNRDTGQWQNSLVFFNDGKYKYIGLVDGNETWNTMVWGGYNETGFAIINSAAYNNNIGDTTKLQDQEGVVMKKALQTCRTLADFEKLLDSWPKPLGVDANFGVIDAYGGAAYYETGNVRFRKFDVNDPHLAPNGIMVRTNHSKSADLTKGYGYVRYETAVNALNEAAAEKKMSPRQLFNAISRNLYHSLTKTDLSANLPLKRDVPDFRFFIDYIPRVSTASAIMVVGARDQNHIREAMMWTILGFPLTSVAVPVWIEAGEPLPKAVSIGKDLKSPLCRAALKLKEDCFPITHDNGQNYLNLSAVINQQQTGYLQLLQPVENEIFSQSELLIRELEKGSKTVKEIPSFYEWIDHFLSEKYQELFQIQL